MPTIYDKYRKQFHKIKPKKRKLGLGWSISLIVIAELFICLFLTTGFSYFLTKKFEGVFSIPMVLLIIGSGTLIGTAMSLLLNRALLSPVRKLSQAMTEVTDGNFDVQLEPKSHFGDIETIYQNFNLMTSELAATEILKTDFVSNVSHEIKTPIGAIEGYAMLLQGDENLSEEQAEYVDKILTNTQRLSELVGNILLISKIENQAIETNWDLYSLDEQIRQSIVLLEPEATKKNVEFYADMDAISYEGNPSLMMHVWNNLIGNAIKFTPDGTTVKITLKQADRAVIFTVDDQGPGIDEQTAKHIFDKFYQGDTSHKQKGNGLGLPLAKQILDLIDGSVTTHNLPEGGCRFTVTLPLAS